MTQTPKVLIVEARFYEELADELVAGAIEALDAAGFGYDRISVPGAFEIPAAIRFAIAAQQVGTADSRYTGYIALGCVIRGETSHYDYVCGESARALMELTQNFSIALGYGILTCENDEQAWARADRKRKNKGADAANACLAMIGLKRNFRL
ncbi:MAG: 6,7-dimethyl-8-ribityllumazine synthase [Rhodospirillales bacterium]